MSSADWMKMTRQRAGSMTLHLGNSDRTDREHSNKEIDKSLSYLNTTIGVSDYEEVLPKLDKRIKEVDAVQPPKRKVKDRIVACMIEIPCPLEIQERGLDQQYFETMYKGLQEYFGDENVLGAFIHRDEQHPYIGKDHKEYISLYHAHCPVVAYTKEHGINGKHFETKARLHQLNDKLNELCLREFGIEMNTHGLAGKQSVEYLKQENKLHELGMQQEVMIEAQEKQQREAAAVQQHIEDKQQELANIERQNALELQKRERMGKTWLGKKKDRIEVDKEQFDMTLEYCKQSMAIDERQQRQQQSLDDRERNLAEEKRYNQEWADRLQQQQNEINKIIDTRVYERTKELERDKQKIALERAKAENKVREYEQTDNLVVKKRDYLYTDSRDEEHTISVEYTIKDMRNIATNKLSENDFIKRQQETAIEDIEQEIERKLSRNRSISR